MKKKVGTVGTAPNPPSRARPLRGERGDLEGHGQLRGHHRHRLHTGAHHPAWLQPPPGRSTTQQPHPPPPPERPGAPDFRTALLAETDYHSSVALLSFWPPGRLS